MKKVALIIGGSSGIGFELVKILLKNQYIVYNASRNDCVLKDVINITYDVFNDTIITDKIKERKIDLVVYASGFSMASPIETVEIEDLRYLFEVNYFGIIKVLKQIIPIMKNNDGGNIILFSSIASFLNIPYDTYYSASKIANNLLALEINMELNRFGIYAKSICIGPTKTNFTFRRKIYDESKNLIDYNDYDDAVNSLIAFEQKGMSPVSVANKIYRVIKRMDKNQNDRYVLNVGIKNKVYYFLAKFMPITFVFKTLVKKYRLKNK